MDRIVHGKSTRLFQRQWKTSFQMFPLKKQDLEDYLVKCKTLLLRIRTISVLRAPFFLKIYLPTLKLKNREFEVKSNVTILLVVTFPTVKYIFCSERIIVKTFHLPGLKRIWKLKLVITLVTFANTSFCGKTESLLT